MSFIWRRRSSILSSSGAGSGAFSGSDDVDPARGGGAIEPEKALESAPEEDNIDDLRRQMKDMQERLERMSKEPKEEE